MTTIGVFIYCILAAKHPEVENPERLNSWRYRMNSVQTDCLQYPVTLAQIPKFERLNQLSINVYGFDAKEQLLHPLYVSQIDVENNDCVPTLHINLLFLSEDVKQHYCLIKNLDQACYILKPKESTESISADDALVVSRLRTSLKTHLTYCRTQKTVQRIKMPKQNNKQQIEDVDIQVNEQPPTLEFKQHRKALRQSLILYGDFECLNEKLVVGEQPNGSYTHKLEHHTPCGFALQPVFQCCTNSDPCIEAPIVHRGSTAVETFLDECLARAETYQEQCDKRNRKVNMSAADWNLFNQTTKCLVCGLGFNLCEDCSLESQPCVQCKINKVRDHCHFCTKYRGAAHSKCNLKNQTDRDVIVAMHNSRRYDTHLVMQKMGIVANNRGFKLDVIAKSSEDYISFSLVMKHEHPTMKKTGTDTPFVCVWRIRFLDTFQFLPSSLDSLVKNLLTKGKSHFHALLSKFPDESQNSLILQKGSYPYNYMDSWERFDETKLPPIEEFYNDLSLTQLSEADYLHAENVFKTFEMINLGDYHDLYVLTDTLLLADVFESFRRFGLENFGLDPVHYFTLPSFGWSALLKLSGVKLDLLTDSEMYRFFEMGIRGGISVITHRHAKANNPYVPDYDSSQPHSYIFYIDANNLYGSTMVQKLPTRSFKWLTEEEIANLSIATLEPDSNIGYVLEVDLDYPAHLHHSHNCYPLAPEKQIITPEQLSPYCRTLNSEATKVPKLIQTLNPKKKYIVHYHNLILYLRLGLKLTKIHRGVTFEQTAWMKDYIEFNTEMRKRATSNFDKDLFKLLNNAVFGKSMENVREYVDLKLISDEFKYLQLVADPRFEESVVFDNALVAVKLKRVTVNLNKPIYVGFTVLEKSKHLMYSFHYDNIVQHYGDRAKLLFSDTDSLCYSIRTNDIYNDIADQIDLYDTSDYPNDHRLHSIVNKKVMGKMKDETNSVPIEEFVGLRPKMYSIKFGGIEKKTAKGISKSVVKKRLTHSDYFSVLQNATTMRHTMRTLRNHLHHMYTIELKKISLSAYDDKRYLLCDGIESYAYGHCEIDT